MPFTDAIGTWQELNFTPITATDDWQLFPNDCKDGITFRLKFDTNWTDWDIPKGYRSFGYLRFAYHDDSGTFDYVGPAIRIYPKREEMLFEFPVLSELKDNPWTIRKAEFKRVKQRYPYPKDWLPPDDPFNFNNAQAPIIDWSLYIEYLVS